MKKMFFMSKINWDYIGNIQEQDKLRLYMKYQGFKPSNNSPPPVIKVKVVDIYMMVSTEKYT